MPKLIKYHYKLYKRFESDIWGSINSNPIFGNRIVRFFQDALKRRAERAKQRFRRFIYRIDIINPSKVYKRKKWKFVSMQLVRLFYRGVNQRKIFFFSRVASSKMGLWVDNFLLLIESRVSIFLYRLNWVPNILFLKQFIGHGNVIVNKVPALNTNYIIKPSEVVQLLLTSNQLIKSNLLKRINYNMIYFNSPRYTFVSYKFMFGIIYRSPKFVDLSFPVLLDVYRLNDLN